ncbi:MAG: ribose 5-phosphate isomerase A [Alphaproteobacteria bacterium]|jgi:ribose 5-phosphate isomerase A
MPFCNKHKAAEKALQFIDKNMRVGLGTGSTANIFIDLLAQKNKQNPLNIQCVATSKVSYERALNHGLTLMQPHETNYLDVAIDGADEFDPQFRLIKGGGGALLREKIIARAAHHFIIIADETKAVEMLGKFPLPVECVFYEEKMIFKQLEKIFNKHATSESDAFIPVFRKNHNNSKIFLTDLGHNIIDLKFNKIQDPECLAHDLQDISGIVDHGLFLNEAKTILTNNDVFNK